MSGWQCETRKKKKGNEASEGHTNTHKKKKKTAGLRKLNNVKEKQKRKVKRFKSVSTLGCDGSIV